jgi:hypothetical protein
MGRITLVGIDVFWLDFFHVELNELFEQIS